MKTRIMLDGARVGTNLETIKGSIALLTDEVTILTKIFKLNKAVQKGLDLELVINNSKTDSNMMMTLRKDCHSEHKWYLNLSGNPLTFFTGCNVYGNPEADTQIVAAFKYCISKAQNTAKLHFPLRIRECILNLEFNISSLEFAGYTGKLQNKLGILNAYEYMFNSTSYNEKTKKHTSLARMLNVSRIDPDEYSTSFRLKVMSGQKLEYMFMLYDKEAQMEAVGKSKPPLDIKDRLRIDLNLCYYWFEKRKIKTMKDFVVYVAKNGNWVFFIQAEMRHVLNRTCIMHMFTFPEAAILDNSYAKGISVRGLNPKISNEAYVNARSAYYVTDSDKIQALLNNSKPLLGKLKTKPIPSYLLSNLRLDTKDLNDD